MKSSKFEKVLGYTLEEIELSIKKGNFSHIASEIKSILNQANHSSKIKTLLDKMESGRRGKLYELLRRMGLENSSIKMAYPFIADYRENKYTLSTAELIEYGASLIFCGSSYEGLSILSSISKQEKEQNPQSLLYTAFGHFSHWDYEVAIPILNQYILLKDNDPYMTIVGKINLSAALIWVGEYEKAKMILTEICQYTLDNKFYFLLGSAYEMLAQIHIFTQSLDDVDDYLNKSYECMQNTEGHGLLFIEKWRMILKFHSRELKKTEAENLLKLFIIKAKNKRHYESIRDSSFHFVKQYPSNSEIIKLCIGTPFPSYRQKLLKAFNIVESSLPKEINLSPFDLVYNSQLSFEKKNPLPFRISLLEDKIKPMRVIRTLLSDFFRPWSIHRLYQSLYPQQYYNPETSKNLIHQSVLQTRRWIVDQRLPIQIQYDLDGYFLSSPKSISLKNINDLYKSQNIMSSESHSFSFDFFIKKLENADWSREFFERHHIEAYFNVSKRTAQRWISEALQAKYLIQKREGHKRFYKRIL